jgi:hypothetical protein
MVRTESLVLTEKVFAVTPGKPRGREPALVLLTIALSGSGMLEQVRPSLTSTPENVALRSVTTWPMKASTSLGAGGGINWS